MRVKQLDLPALFKANESEYLEAIKSVCERAAFIGGTELKEFETRFAAWVGEGLNALGCANGTDAITLAALALDLPPNSEAIVPAMTFVATVEGLKHAELQVRLVDIDPKTWVMDPNQVEAAMTEKTKLIVPVHLYGQMAEMDRLREIADRYQCRILEDASQAHGAKWKGFPVGHWGDIATYSFYPGKNLGAFGDGGAILSRNQKLIERSFLLANHGSPVKYQHKICGWNSRLDNLQAAILNVKLNFLSRWNSRRKSVAKFYDESLKTLPGITLPFVHEEAESVYHQYVLKVPDREKFIGIMKKHGVEVGIHYPLAVHQLQAFPEWNRLSFPESEALAAQCVSLPMCPTLGPEELNLVVEAVHDSIKALR